MFKNKFIGHKITNKQTKNVGVEMTFKVSTFLAIGLLTVF